MTIRKERELLKGALSWMVDLSDIYADERSSDDRIKLMLKEDIIKIQELLAQPEQIEQEPFAVVANNSVRFDVSRSPQGMPLVWLGKLEYGDKLYRLGVDDE